MRTTTLLTTIGLGLGLALTVSGCTGGDRDAVPPTPNTSTTATPTPTPAGSATPGPTPAADASSTTTAPATAAGKVPATCDDVVTPGTFDFTDVMPLNDPAVVGGMEIPRTALTPAGRSDGQRLYCVWRDPRADVSNLTVLVEDVVPSRATEALRGLSGYDCSTVDDGFRCQQVEQNQQYPVIDGDTYFTRGGIGIRITQSNVPTDGLLDDVVGNVFG